MFKCTAQWFSYIYMGFPGRSDSKEPACNAGDPGSIPGLGRSPWEGNSNQLQYPCLGNPMDGEPGRLQSMGHKESDTTEWLSTHVHTHTCGFKLHLQTNYIFCTYYSSAWLVQIIKILHSFKWKTKEKTWSW